MSCLAPAPRLAGHRGRQSRRKLFRGRNPRRAPDPAFRPPSFAPFPTVPRDEPRATSRPDQARHRLRRAFRLLWAGFPLRDGRTGSTSSVSCRRPASPRSCVGKLYSLAIGAPQRNQAASAAELRWAIAQRLRSACPWPHRQSRRPSATPAEAARPAVPVAGDGAFPAGALGGGRHCRRARQARSTRIHFLPNATAAFFSARLGSASVSTILHGVDCDFFHPDKAQRASDPRLLFVGKWLRGFRNRGPNLRGRAGALAGAGDRRGRRPSLGGWL